jgi:hypothetical protein
MLLLESGQERAQVFECANARTSEIRMPVVAIDQHGSHACGSALVAPIIGGKGVAKIE